MKRQLDRPSGMIYGIPWEAPMETAKVAISMNKKTLARLDRLVKDQVFPKS